MSLPRIIHVFVHATFWGIDALARNVRLACTAPNDHRLFAPAKGAMMALLRNDLSRVCRPESVQVSQLCKVETYEYVLHLVSAVCGKLHDDCSPVDLVRAAFPGGSVNPYFPTGERRYANAPG